MREQIDLRVETKGVSPPGGPRGTQGVTQHGPSERVTTILSDLRQIRGRTERAEDRNYLTRKQRTPGYRPHGEKVRKVDKKINKVCLPMDSKDTEIELVFVFSDKFHK